MARTRPQFDAGIDAHERRIQGVLRYAFSQGFEPIFDRTPLDDLIEAEAEVELSAEAADGEYKWPARDAEDSIQLQYLKAEEAALVAQWTRKRLMHWIAGEGIHPFKICQRFYAMCFARYPELIGPLNGHWLAEILGLGRAAFSACMQRLFNRPVEAKTGQLLTTGGQKNAKSKGRYAENAAKNKPRQKMNTSGLSDDDEAAEARRAHDERRERLRRELVLDRKKEDTANEELFRQMRERAAALATDPTNAA